MENIKKYFVCQVCHKLQNSIGIKQKEIHYYEEDLETGQWKDFHGDEEILKQEYFCLKCNEVFG